MAKTIKIRRPAPTQKAKTDVPVSSGERVGRQTDTSLKPYGKPEDLSPFQRVRLRTEFLLAADLAPFLNSLN